MKFLLDTCILLWAASGKLSHDAEQIINNKDNELFFSSASIWKITIKNDLAKKDFSVDPFVLYNGLLANGYEEVEITGRHALQLSILPPIHKDPFDRIMLAQAITEGFTFLTADKTIGSYPGPIKFIR